MPPNTTTSAVPRPHSVTRPPVKVIVAGTYGGLYPLEEGRNFIEPYLRQVMAFIGIHEVTFIHAEGLNMGGDFHEKGLNQANAKLSQVA